LSNFVFCLGSIVDLCHYRFSEMDHKICYFLGRLTTNIFQLQGGGLRCQVCAAACVKYL